MTSCGLKVIDEIGWHHVKWSKPDSVQWRPHVLICRRQIQKINIYTKQTWSCINLYVYMLVIVEVLYESPGGGKREWWSTISKCITSVQVEDITVLKVAEY
jgi:hypothetical protein